MHATVISDKDNMTGQFKELEEQILSFLDGKGFEIERISIGRNDLAFCMGCYRCWVKKPGECAINDLMAQINRKFIKSDVAVYLSPIIFGHFSANIKNALDRSIPNLLPFFTTKSDGSSAHPFRYKTRPRRITVGYAEKLTQEDAQLFTEIIMKHQSNSNVIIYRNTGDEFLEELNKLAL